MKWVWYGLVKLFQVYTADIPLTKCRQFIYANDIISLAALQSTFKNVSHPPVLYWWIFSKTNTTKSQVECFHLNNILHNLKLTFYSDGGKIRQSHGICAYLSTNLLLLKGMFRNEHHHSRPGPTRAAAVDSSWRANTKSLRTNSLLHRWELWSCVAT